MNECLKLLSSTYCVMSASVAHVLREKARTEDIVINENINFEGLLLSEAVLKGLRNSGFERPSPIQLKAIPLGRCGLDLIVQAKSGTGKTCVFTVIALESIQVDTNALQVLVLAPTREIAIQIWDVIKSIGSAIPSLQCQTFIGGMPVQEDKQKLKRCHIAVGTPGRIKQMIESNMMKTESIRMFILDEADKLLEESFQEQINWIYSSLPDNKQMLALSATYPEYLAEHLTAYMRNPTFLRLNISDPALLGIKQFKKIVAFHPLPSKQFEYKMKAVVDILSSVNFQQCLMFSNLQTRAQNISHSLNSKGWPTAYIAGSHDQRDRNEAMAKLKTYKCRVLVSTDLTARGIDADKVNMVINLDVPKHHETYLHRIGRAGRFGSFGAAITIVCVGQEEMDLYRTEQKCNTSIKDLPDPIPPTLTKSDCLVRLDDMVSTEKINTDSTRLSSPTKEKKEVKQESTGYKEITFQEKGEGKLDNNQPESLELKGDKRRVRCNDADGKGTDDKTMLHDNGTLDLTCPQDGGKEFPDSAGNQGKCEESLHKQKDVPSGNVRKLESSSLLKNSTNNDREDIKEGSMLSPVSICHAKKPVLSPVSQDFVVKDSANMIGNFEEVKSKKGKKSKQATPEEMSTRKIAKARRRFSPVVTENNSDGNIKKEATRNIRGTSDKVEIKFESVKESIEEKVALMSLDECDDNVNKMQMPSTSSHKEQKSTTKSLEVKREENEKEVSIKKHDVDIRRHDLKEFEKAHQSGYRMPSVCKMIGYEEIQDLSTTEKVDSYRSINDQSTPDVNIMEICPSAFQLRSEEIQQSILHVKSFLFQRRNKMESTIARREMGIQTDNSVDILTHNSGIQKMFHDKSCETDLKEFNKTDSGLDQERYISNEYSREDQKSRFGAKEKSCEPDKERKGRKMVTNRKNCHKKGTEDEVFHCDNENDIVVNIEDDFSSSNGDSESETSDDSNQSVNKLHYESGNHKNEKYLYDADSPVEFDTGVYGDQQFWRNPHNRCTQDYVRNEMPGQNFMHNSSAKYKDTGRSSRQTKSRFSSKNKHVDQGLSYYGQVPYSPWGQYPYLYGMPQYYSVPYFYDGIQRFPSNTSSSTMSRSWMAAYSRSGSGHKISKMKLMESSMKMQEDYIRNMLRC